MALPAAGAAQATPPAVDPLAQRIDAILSTPPMDGVHWGVLLVDAETGRTLYERNAHLRFVPASNMKIPVTAAALDRLGPEFRYRTAFLADPAAWDPADPTRLRGDLVLAASGDPSLGDPFHPSGEAAFQALADSLLATGLREVEGRLVVDGAAWDSTTVPTGWLVGNLNARYAATGGAFGMDAGELEIRVRGGAAAGEPATLSWTPLGTPDFVENRIRTGAAGEEADLRTAYLPESRRWVVEGTLPPGTTVTLLRAQRDPVRQASHALHRVLEARGIRVRGGVGKVWEPGVALVAGCAAGSVARCPTAVEVAGMDSPPLTEIVRAILEPSQNWITEQLVRTLGREVGEGGSWGEGFDVIRSHMVEAVGVDSLDVHFRDGSGLAGYNLLTPRSVVQVLDHARTRPWALAFYDAMAEPGKPGTTLAGRLAGLEGRVHAKTGTISHVSALSGYLVSDDGRPLLFAVLSNAANLPAAQVRSTIDQVVRAMAGVRTLDGSPAPSLQ